MEVKTITYQRVKNLGNYESHRIELTVEIDKEDKLDNVISNIKAWVNTELQEAEVVENSF